MKAFTEAFVNSFDLSDDGPRISIQGYDQKGHDFLKIYSGTGGFSTDATALLEAQADWFANNPLGGVTDPVKGLTLAKQTFDASSRPLAQQQLLLLTDDAVNPGPGLDLGDQMKEDGVKIFCVFYGDGAVNVRIAPLITSGDGYFILASSLDDTIDKVDSACDPSRAYSLFRIYRYSLFHTFRYSLFHTFRYSLFHTLRYSLFHTLR